MNKTEKEILRILEKNGGEMLNEALTIAISRNGGSLIKASEAIMCLRDSGLIICHGPSIELAEQATRRCTPAAQTL